MEIKLIYKIRIPTEEQHTFERTVFTDYQPRIGETLILKDMEYEIKSIAHDLDEHILLVVLEPGCYYTGEGYKEEEKSLIENGWKG